MKTIISILLLLLSSLAGLSQSNTLYTEIETSYIYYSELDSVPLEKLVMILDSTQHIQSWEYYTWDSISNAWFKAYGAKYYRSYDSQGEISLSDCYLWNTSQKIWLANFRWEPTRDNSGNIIQVLNYAWDSTSANWIYDLKFEWTFNQAGFITLSQKYNWDRDLGAWINYSKQENCPDEMGQDTLRIYDHWNQDSGAWEHLNKYEYAYDSAGNETYRGSFQWDTDSVYWRPGNKYYGKWNTAGKPLVEYWLQYQSSPYIWDGLKYTYSYDTISNTCIRFGYINHYQADTSDWTPSGYGEFKYDELEREISYIQYRPDSSVASISETSYDSFGNTIDYYFYRYDDSGTLGGQEEYEYYFDENGNKKLDVSYTWHWYYNPQGKFVKTFYYKYSYLVGVERIQTGSDAILYPNPASDWLYISYDIEDLHIEIYDLSGRKRISSDEKVINLAGLEQGVYLVRLMKQEGATLDTRRIIKQ